MNNTNIFRFTTNKVVLFHPHLLQPNTNKKFENSRPKYGTTIIISKDDTDTLTKINSAIDSIMRSNSRSDPSEIKLPLKDGDADYPTDKLFQNSMYMYVSTALQPNIVDHKVKKILFRASEFETGSYSKVSIEPVQYTIGDKLVIAFELINVQIFPQNKLLEMRSTPEDDFQVEED